MDMPAGGSIAQISMHNKFQELLAMTDLDYNQDSSLFLFFWSLHKQPEAGYYHYRTLPNYFIVPLCNDIYAF